MRLPKWLSAALCAVGCAPPPPTWSEVTARVRASFPEVEQVSTSQVADWLARPRAARPLVLDARSPSEFAVSHLDGALRAATLEEALALLAGRESDTPIVAYCSVGHRSSRLVSELAQHGYARAVNLEGSIFTWANEGRPLYRGDPPNQQPVEVVHPYDESWGRLLDRARWGTDPTDTR